MKIERVDFSRSRIYTIDDKIEVPSVTTILTILDKGFAFTQWHANTAVDYFKLNLIDKILADEISAEDIKATDNSELMDRAKDYHNKLLQEAGDIGRKTHHKISEFLKKVKACDKDIQLTIEKEIDRPMNAFFSWWHKNKVTPIEIDLRIYNDLGRYAGELDVIIESTSGIFLVDFKSGNGVYHDNKLQAAAYWGAFLRNHNKEKIAFDGILILRLDKKTGQPFEHTWTIEETEDYYKEFLLTAEQYHMRENRKKRKKKKEEARRFHVKELKKSEKQFLKTLKEDPF